MSVEVAEVLERAAEIIVERGWCQRPEPKSERRCIIMALNQAEWEIYGELMGPDPHWTVMDYLGLQQIPTELPVLWAYNDAEGRTEEEVLAALRGAAAREREA